MSRKTDVGSSNAQYTRSYGNLRGVDFSADPSQLGTSRCSYLVNMYRDYDSEHGAAIETIPGYRRLFHFDGEVHGMWGYSSTQEDDQDRHVVVHAGTKLYTFKMDERDSGNFALRYEGLADSASTAFLQNNNFYICDGVGIYIMKSDFSVKPIQDEAYVPITYLHGNPYEQRNMLTDKFINQDTVVSNGIFTAEYKHPDDNTIPSGEQVIEGAQEHFTCTVSKFYGDTGALKHYIIRITGFVDPHQADLQLKLAYLPGEVYTSEWYDQANLKPCTVIFQIEGQALIDAGIKNVILQQGVGVRDLDSVIAAGINVYIGKPIGMYHSEVYIYTPCTDISSVKINGEEIKPFSLTEAESSEKYIGYILVREHFFTNEKKKEYCSYLLLFSNTNEYNAGVIEIEGVADPVVFQTSDDVAAVHTDYLNANTEYDGTATEAILGCRISCTFDGRVFLTGNPRLPNTVFYSCRDLTGYNNPSYYGVYNYFNDGEGNEPNVALLPTSSVLMVLKRNTLQGSAIYYHVAAEGIDDIVPKIYPSTPGVAGLGCEGPAINFLDDAVFLSERGLEGLSKQQLNLERTIGHRSSSVDKLLQRKDLSNAHMCRFGGYLCIFDGEGSVFLADSKQLYEGQGGTAEYEWYYLEGVGDYEGDHELYKTLKQYPEVYAGGGKDELRTLEGATLYGAPLLVSESSEEVDPWEVFTGDAVLENDETAEYFSVKYVERNGGRFLCDTDGERGGGTFSPACVGYAQGNVFLFGTKNGSVCCFNMDKRGIDPFDEGSVEANGIHRSFYSFAGHRYLSGLALKSDNCGVPHLTKRTSRKTCVAKLKTMRGSGVSVKIRTDRTPWHEVVTSFANADFSFSNLEFDHFSFSSEFDTIITIKDKEKKWVEKQFYFFSDGYCRPFGFHDLTFNYEIQGRVKKG